jgi:hypothetical protein
MNEVVQRLVKKHGLEMTVHSGSRESRVFDFSLTTADGDHIGIECTRTLGLRSDRDVTRFLNRVNEAFGPVNVREIVFVANRFPQQVRDTLDAYHGVQFVELDHLDKWLDRYTQRTRSRGASIGSNVRANRDQIILSASSLRALIEEKLAALKDEKPNSPERIAARNASIADYEELKRRVGA